MVFKRRDARSWTRVVAEFFYPKGGWRRAASYVVHRLRRLPDAPHRIARGIFAGTMVSFLPLFGFHFLSAAAVAFVIRGNIVAALLGTFVGNPFTFPFMAAASLEIGHWMLGTEAPVHLSGLMRAFSLATGQLWTNFLAIFGEGTAQWDYLSRFYRNVWLPYMLGGVPAGIIGGTVLYYVSLPIIGAYQKLRSKKTRDRLEARVAARAAKMAAAPDDQSGSAEP